MRDWCLVIEDADLPPVGVPVFALIEGNNESPRVRVLSLMPGKSGFLLLDAKEWEDEVLLQQYNVVAWREYV